MRNGTLLTANETPEHATSICSMYAFNHGNHCYALICAERVSTSFSIIGCLITLGILLFYKRYMEYSQRLTLNLCVAAFLEAICFYFIDKDSTILLENDGQPTSICILQAAWLLYCLWAVLLWTLFIAVDILLNIMWAKSLRKFEVLLSFGCWAIPGIIVSIPFFVDENARNVHVYAPSGSWCWINDKHTSWQMGLWYSWAFISFVGLFILVLYKNCKKGTTSAERALYFSFKWQQPVLTQDIHIIRVHHTVIFFLIFVLFPFINDMYYAVNEEYLFELVLLETLSMPFVGGAITVSFMIDKSTRHVLHPKVISEILRRRFKVIEDLLKEERTTSCDTFMIDIFSTTASGDASSRESSGSHYYEKHENAAYPDILQDEISDLRHAEISNANVSIHQPTQGQNRDSQITLTAKLTDLTEPRQLDSEHLWYDKYRSRLSSFGRSFDGTKLHYIEESKC